jgi:hypothetical protein
MDIGPSNRKTCRAQLDIGPRTTESLVVLKSTLDLVQQKALSSSIRHWTWYNGKPCRAQLDIGPGTTERLVELNSTLELVQQKALSKLLDIGPGTTERLVEINSNLDCNRPARPIHSVVFAWNLLHRTKMVECCEIKKEELLRWCIVFSS